MSGLEVRGLTRSHPGSDGRHHVAVRGVGMSVSPGENVALIGRSGCGKTTLLRALLLLDSPGPQDRGEVLLDDEVVRRGGARSLRAFRRAVQYVPQDAAATLDPHRGARSRRGRCTGPAGAGEPGRTCRHLEVATARDLRRSGPAGLHRPGPGPVAALSAPR